MVAVHEQLTIFDFLEGAEGYAFVSPLSPKYSLNDRVKVLSPSPETNEEDFYYLERFKNKVGVIVERYQNKKGFQYYVTFPSMNETGIFYEGDLTQ
ncbi:hypothetical protein CON64_18590 [Bacillus pseudomycoides]|nr:hypothetical protein CON64_18590 [Bacillus pseudomycoides]